jgi:hypothetical protein
MASLIPDSATDMIQFLPPVENTDAPKIITVIFVIIWPGTFLFTCHTRNIIMLHLQVTDASYLEFR